MTPLAWVRRTSPSRKSSKTRWAGKRRKSWWPRFPPRGATSAAKPGACPRDLSARRAAFWLFPFMADILTNSKARRDYHIIETFEAGIVLHGTEVKALRAGKAQISDAFARVDNNEVFLHNAHIDEYAFGNIQNHVPKSVRKLLLHKSEIRKLFSLSSV